MSSRNICGLLLFVAAVTGMVCCDTGGGTETAAMTVVDVIPQYIPKALFDTYILGKGDDNADVVISEYYKLNEALQMYVVPDEIVTIDPTLKKDDRNKIEAKQKDILVILRTVGFTPVYKEPKEGEVIAMLSCFENVVCLNKDNPKVEKTKDPEGNPVETEWYRIRTGEDTGYVQKGHLIFKSAKATDAVVIADAKLQSAGYYREWYKDEVLKKWWRMWSEVGDKDLYRGEEVKWLGFVYNDTKNYYQVKRFNDDIGWVSASIIVPDANKGVLLSDVDIYMQPDDMDKSRIKDKKYKMMDLLIILEQLADKNWLKVVYDDLDKEFYINTGGLNIISPNSTDIAVASRLYDDYYGSMEIIGALREKLQNQSSFPQKELKEIMDKATQLEAYKNEIEDVLGNDRYKDNAFAFELKKLLDEIELLISDIEYLRQIYKPSDVDEKADTNDAGEGSQGDTDEVIDAVVE
ncbi:MAG: hypothetical protein JW881_01945 [Spirochaetales bacterium]|nr:hypothetical protein [Spirochaetales bacterium]